MRFDLKDIQRAKIDHSVYEEIHDAIFRQVDPLLYGSGVTKLSDQEMLKSEFAECLWNIIANDSYYYEHIEFYKFVLVKFDQMIVDYFRKQNRHKNLICLDDVSNSINDNSYVGNDLLLDLNEIIKELPDQAVKIVKYIVYSGMSRNEIMGYLKINAQDYHIEMEKIRQVFTKYLINEL
ncbi:MAG: hypothetical protein ACXAC7_22690 [Candidatus Hodarchaeales archaeon]